MGTEDRLGELAARLAEGDFEALREHLAADYFGAPRGEGEAPANDRITDLALDFRTALPDLTAVLDGVTPGDDETATATLTLRGTFTGSMYGAPGSGDVIEWVTPVTIRSVGDRFAVRIDDASTPQLIGLIRQLRLVNPADEMHLPRHFPVTMNEFLLKLVFTGQAGNRPCSHLGDIHVVEPTASVCEQCVASGDVWPALRMCLVCGFVGCCDTSTNRHMAAHHQETGHPIMRSIHDQEGWVWCYDDDAFFEKALLDRYR